MWSRHDSKITMSGFIGRIAWLYNRAVTAPSTEPIANGTPNSFDGLSEFLAIVRRGGFRAAALELGVTPGAVSQAVQALERRLGLPVFHRTTRKVTLTEAGEKLFQRLDPAAETITSLLEELIQMRARPGGTLRLLVHRIALRHVVEPVLPQFREAWPDVKVEITIDDTHAELVAGGFDAGIRIGEYIDRDMIAVRVSPIFSWIVVGAPDYFSRRGRPLTPEDLARHEMHSLSPAGLWRRLSLGVRAGGQGA